MYMYCTKSAPSTDWYPGWSAASLGCNYPPTEHIIVLFLICAQPLFSFFAYNTDHISSVLPGRAGASQPSQRWDQQAGAAAGCEKVVYVYMSCHPALLFTRACWTWLCMCVCVPFRMPGPATGGSSLILPGSWMLRAPSLVPALRKRGRTMKPVDLPKRWVCLCNFMQLNAVYVLELE